MRRFISRAILSISSVIALFLILHISNAVCAMVHQGESIQAAIDAAKPGDVIEVESGTYYENIDINKPVVLRGIGYPVIDAMGNCPPVILSAGGTFIGGFGIRNSDIKRFFYNACGISVNSSGNTIRGNRISNHTCGICVNGSSNNIVANNIVNGSILGGTGIDLLNCHNNLIENNVVSHNRMIGISLENSTCNVLRGNLVFDNAWAFPLLGEFQFMAGGTSFLKYARNNTFYQRRPESFGRADARCERGHLCVSSISHECCGHYEDFSGSLHIPLHRHRLFDQQAMIICAAGGRAEEGHRSPV